VTVRDSSVVGLLRSFRAIRPSYRFYHYNDGPMAITKADVKRVAALQEAKGRAEQGLMLLEGPRLVAEGLKAGTVERIFRAADFAGAEALKAIAGSVPIDEVSPADLDRMVEVRTPAGVAATARINPPRDAAELVKASSRLLYLESVQDPGNVGTLARTAWALGVDGLLVSPGTADALSPKTLRASAGTLVTMPYAREVEPEALLGLAAASGHRVVVSDAHEGADYRKADPGQRFILVASNEGAGTALSLKDPRLVVVRIPLERGAESLNVAAAVAILLATFRPKGR
jgi:TrmH family RNA methyltransferase